MPPETDQHALDTDALPDEGLTDSFDADIAAFFEAAAGNPGDEPEVTPETEPTAEVEQPAAEDTEPGPVGDGTIPIAPPADEEPAAPATVTIGGVEYPVDQVEQLVGWAQQRTADEWQRINGALAPQPAASGSGTPAPDATTSGAGDGQQIPDLAVLGELSPELVPFLKNLHESVQATQAQLAAEQRRMAEWQASQAQVQQQQAMATIEAAGTQWKERHPGLTDADWDRIQRHAVDLQVLPGLIHQNGGDHGSAYQQALDTAMWSLPDLRARAVQAQIDQHTSQLAATAERRRNAASLSGTSGSAPRMSEPVQPATQQERNAAIVRELTEAITGQPADG